MEDLDPETARAAAMERAAFYKLRTWNAIQQRVRAGEGIGSVAHDFGVTERWVQHVCAPENDLRGVDVPMIAPAVGQRPVRARRGHDCGACGARDVGVVTRKHRIVCAQCGSWDITVRPTARNGHGADVGTNEPRR